MKKYFVTLILLTSISFGLMNAQTKTFNIATYNLRFDNKDDIGNLWKDRVPYLAKLIAHHDFDIFGTQEGHYNQLQDIKNLLPVYDFFGEGRDGGNKGEHSAIFYKTSKYKLLDGGNFWLSATPNVPSKSWDATCCNRICSWVKLQEKSNNRIFFVFNAHYDYEKDYARQQSSLLVLKKIKEIAGNYPTIFTGDLNGCISDSWCKILNESGVLKDTFFDTKSPYWMRSSYNAFGQKRGFDRMDSIIVNDKQVIDHIYFSKQIKTQSWSELTDTYNLGKYPSDHCPVMVKAEWKK